MKKYLLAIVSLAPLLLAIGSACSITHHRHYTNCDDGLLTGLNKRIATNGYYSYKTTYKHEKPSPSEGTIAMQLYLTEKDYDIYTSVVFYEDGTECSASSYSSPEDAADRIKNKTDRFGYWVSWGRYKINGDTIKVQFLLTKDYANAAIAEDWYRINKNKTITYVARLFRNNGHSKDYYDQQGFSKNTPQPEPCSFTQLATKPDSMLSTLRGKKWYRCK